MTTPVPPITPVPEFPDMGDRINYNAKAYAWATAMRLVFPPEVSAVASSALANATESLSAASAANSSALAAAAAQNAAALSAAAAAASAGATMWASGNYTFGAVVWSPSNGLNYRRSVAGTTSSTVDPGITATGWFLMGAPLSLPQIEVTVSTSYQLNAGIHYIVVNPLADMLMPASPTQQQTVRITNKSDSTTPILRRNGSNFDSIADDCQLDTRLADKTFTYSTSTRGWI